MLLGTTYVSPAFADKIFRVPVIGKLVEDNSILYTLQEGLNKEQYTYDSLYISYQEKSIELTIPEEEYDSKQQVKKLTEDILSEGNVQGFSVHIAKVSDREEDEVLDNVDNSQSVEIIDLLHKNNLSDLILSSGSSYTDEGKLVVEYSVYDTVSKSDIAEIKDLTRNQVVGIEYSVYPTIELTIKTSIESRTESETQQFIADLEKEIRRAIEDSEEVQEDYQVIIKDKNHHRIN
ncbi:hypothetical protein [Terribacillus saccharophilus]|uniref:hypothetical protein n=1 Tax=Terribacillus saccharophilus TaxID=361277 RepID=UPI001140B76F|nr:hypothetical protein [Terribacillus saccharophilus]